MAGGLCAERSPDAPDQPTDGSQAPATDDNLVIELRSSRRPVKMRESVARPRSRVGMPDYKWEIPAKGTLSAASITAVRTSRRRNQEPP